MLRQLALVIRGSGYRGLRHLPKQGPAATNPPLPAWVSCVSAPTPPPGEFRLGAAVYGGVGFWCWDVVREAAIKEELAGGWGGGWILRPFLSLTVPWAGAQPHTWTST